jgi:hypothetical protein
MEDKLSKLSNASIEIDSNYTSYNDVRIVENNFIFRLHNKEIEIPVSSYFFDIWNKKIKQVASGE